MRFKYAIIGFGVLALAAASAMADDLEAQKGGQSLPAPVSLPDAPRVDLEALKQGQSPGVAPVSPSNAPRIDLEAQKKGLKLAPAPASAADAPGVDLESLKRLGKGSVTSPR